MIPCLYASTEMKFNHNGIGKLADAQSCTVTEKRNGSYELKLVCPADGIHAEMLEEGNIILAKPSDTMQSQPFRIYKITTPIDGKLEVQARHISYQLNFITVSPFSVTGCVGAMQGLKSHAASDCPFEVWTDVESSATFTLGVPSSFRNCLGGMAGSVLDVFGGEFEWDRYTVRFHKARGADHNVHIIYGKNLTDFRMEKSIENTITGVHPYWVDNETQAVMELPEKVVLQSKRSIPYQKITVLDCTSNFQEKPSEAALREYTQNYIDTTDLTEPEIDIKIDFLQLWNTPGYRFRGQFVEDGDNKLMLFELDEPEMIKVEEIVLPPKENSEEAEGETVKKTIYIFPPEWAGTFGQPITSIAQVGIFQQEHYAGNWDVLRPAAEIEEMNTFTADGLNALLHEAEEIMEGWTEIDE